MTIASGVKANAKTNAQQQPETWLDFVKTVVVALLMAMVIRSAIAQPFRIPSGSMQPTLLVGDYIVVTKWAYGYSRFSLAPFVFLPKGRVLASQPQRGDVIVFRPVHEPNVDYVKRLIGLPGDEIQMKGGLLHINGVPVQRELLGLRDFKEESGNFVRLLAYKETLPNGQSYTVFDRQPDALLDDTPVYRVPAGNYFMMGDDRDNSDDSRQNVGYVPFERLVGKAEFVFASWDPHTSLLRPWTLISDFRAARFAKGLE